MEERLLGVLGGAFCAGCGSLDARARDTAPTAFHVGIYASESQLRDVDYQVVGTIVDTDPAIDSDAKLWSFRSRAASIGANAIVINPGNVAYLCGTSGEACVNALPTSVLAIRILHDRAR